MTPWKLHADVCIGHVHLKVADLERALAFYSGVLGFDVMQRHGADTAFLSAGGYHHHLALNTWESRGATPAPPGHTGLFHLAIRYPDRHELARALQRVLDHDVPVWGALDHGATEAIYLYDPDGNGVELCCDRPRTEWPMDNGQLVMGSCSIELQSILDELPREAERAKGTRTIVRPSPTER